jgi:DNA-binding PadR family transcriptional regulator
LEHPSLEEIPELVRKQLSHLLNLEENGFLKIKKGFVGKKTNTTYSVTKAGEKAFADHIAALENMIKGVK